MFSLWYFVLVFMWFLHTFKKTSVKWPGDKNANVNLKIKVTVPVHLRPISMLFPGLGISRYGK